MEAMEFRVLFGSNDNRKSALAVLFVLLLVVGCGRQVPKDYENPYGASLFLPSELRLEGAELLKPGDLAGSEGCAVCHPEIYRQWQSSLHRVAATDPNTRYAITRMGEDYGIAATRLCEGCHQPGAVLSGSIDKGAPRDEATYREGVSCLSCHLAKSVHEVDQIGKVANASITFEMLDREILYPPVDAGREALERHGVALRRPWLSENRFCASCHRFFIPTQMVGNKPGRPRLQSAEAENSRFGDPSASGYQSCVDCHMPLMEAYDPAAKDGMVHDHRSLGSNMFVPSLIGDEEQVAATLAFRRASPVTIEVGELERDERGRLRLPVTLVNDKNGHDFPTGATDISETWLELELRDSSGKLVYESPGLDEERYLSDKAPSLSTVVAIPGGNPDYLHDLFYQVELVRYPRVHPEKTLTLAFSFDLPVSVQGPLTAMVSLHGRHGNERWNRWMFNWQEIEVPVADIAEVESRLASVPPPLVRSSVPPPSDVPEAMVYVPGGFYTIGSSVALDPLATLDEYPPHAVQLAPFFIDRVPVTNREWAKAVAEGLVPAPNGLTEAPLDQHNWKGGQVPAGKEDHPIVLVWQEEAARYCESLGKRLPTEGEWEAAARGHEARRYAWGEQYDPALCNTSESGRFHSIPVGSSPGNASPFGALDMGCNVSEWTATRYQAYPRVRHIDNRHDWVDRYSRDFIVTRGATYETLGWRSRASHRGTEEPDSRKLVGFRCVKDAGGSAKQ